MLKFMPLFILQVFLLCIMIDFLVTDLRDNKDRNKNDELESEHYSYFKTIFAKFSNSDNDCREIRIQKIDFLKTIFCENLSHARHIEMERMTFNSIYTVLIAGIFAFVNTSDKSCVNDCILNNLVLFFGFMTGFILFCISIRWKDVYNRHLFYAKVSYIYLKDMIFPEKQFLGINEFDEYLKEESILFNNERIFSLYCFKPAHITEVGLIHNYNTYFKTYQYFLILDILIEFMIFIAFMYITGILK